MVKKNLGICIYTQWNKKGQDPHIGSKMMELEMIMVSEISQTQKDEHPVFSFLLCV